MTDALCVAEDCRGGHLSGCDDDQCRGCGPDRAADGKWLCRWHCNRLEDWPMEAAEVYADLALMLNRTGVMAERVSATPDRGLSVNEAAVKARTPSSMRPMSGTPLTRCECQRGSASRTAVSGSSKAVAMRPREAGERERNR